MPAPKQIDLSIINEGLEYAQFKEFRIREAINKIVKQLQLDLEDVGFEPSPETTDSIKELEELYLEIETANVRVQRSEPKIRDKDEVVEFRKVREEEEDDIIEERPHKDTKKIIQIVDDTTE